MKKIIMFAAIAVASLAFVGCEKKEAPAEQAKDLVKATTTEAKAAAATAQEAAKDIAKEAKDAAAK
jgi:PBP1b-binding outer membrane lipoprotein LpoB